MIAAPVGPWQIQRMKIYRYEDLTPEIERATLPILIQAYDRPMLDQWSLTWFEKLEADINALPEDAAKNLFQDHHNRLVKAYAALSLRHLSDALTRVREMDRVDEDVRYWAGEFICTFIEPKSEALIAQQWSEGIHPATGEPLPPGWLQLDDVDEVYDAWKTDIEKKIDGERGGTVVEFPKGAR